MISTASENKQCECCLAISCFCQYAKGVVELPLKQSATLKVLVAAMAGRSSEYPRYG